MKVIRLLHEILREIFEEAAYERFCVRNQVRRSKDSYFNFVSATAGAENKMRCC